MCATSAGASGELYACMEASDAKRLKQLEDENRQLKRLWDQALNL
jgi:hypothetical protein